MVQSKTMKEEIKTSDRDALSAAMIMTNEARKDVAASRLKRADNKLASAQRLLIVAGAKDIGKIPDGRDLIDNVFSILDKKEKRIKALENKIEEQESEIEQLKSEDGEGNDDFNWPLPGEGSNDFSWPLPQN